jgi:hypothetical protein
MKRVRPSSTGRGGWKIGDMASAATRASVTAQMTLVPLSAVRTRRQNGTASEAVEAMMFTAPR